MNLMKLAKWTLFYVLQWAVLYAAFWLRMDGALHIAEVSGCLRAPMPEDARRTAAGSPLDRPVGPVAGA